MSEPTGERLLGLVRNAIENARPERLGVAVSGGGDSMALLDLCVRLSEREGIPLRVVTVDHGLRPEAHEESALVGRYCAGRGIVHDVLSWKWDGQGNLQARAREARYRLIAEWVRRQGLDAVALGHTQDDLAETFLMRLARKSGVDGLAAMEADFHREGVRWLRPLLGARRAELRDYLGEAGIGWADDASNEDRTFDRVKARDAMAALAPLGVGVPEIGQVARNLAEARDALDFLARLAAREAREDRGDLILRAAPKIDGQQVPDETLFRLRRAALRWVGGQDYPPRTDALRALSDALARGETRTLAGCLVSPAGDGSWRIAREYAGVEDLSAPIGALWDGRWRIEGPRAPGLEVKAVGNRLPDCPNWRETGLPRTSLMASPGIWRGDEMVAAPLAGWGEGWVASAEGRGSFADFLDSR